MFEQLEVTEIIKSIDQDAERTILTAVIKVREFPIVNLTASERATSVADLAYHLTQLVPLMDLDPEISHDDHVSHTSQVDREETVSSSYVTNLLREVDHGDGETPDGATTPTQALPFPRVQKSPRWSAKDSDSWPTSPSRGLTFPSAVSDVLNVSGCTIPS